MATNNVVNSIYVPLAGGTMTGSLILNADPSVALGAVTKQYADAISAGLDFKNACVVATIGVSLTVTYSNGISGVGATLTNAGTQAVFTLDGQSPTVGQRILIKDQTSTFQNGIYIVSNVGSLSTNWILTRSTDYDTAAEISPGDLVPITSGTVNADTLWLQTSTVAAIGTGNPITFSQFSSAPLALPVSLSNGGTNANLTANNGGVFYSTASAGAVLAGTATARQMLQSGASSAPAWSTATWPATTTVSQLLYSSSANVVAGLTTANSAAVVTTSAGVPVLSGTMTNGQVIIGSTGATPTAAAITAGTNITVTNGAGSISIASSAGGTAGLTLIASVTASNSATVNFDNDLSATYDNYLIVFEKMQPVTTSTVLRGQVGTGGTPTYSSSTYAGYAISQKSNGATAAASGTSAIDFNNTSVPISNSTSYSCCGTVNIFNVNDTGTYKNVLGFLINFETADSAVGGNQIGNIWATTTALTSFKFLMSSGNISVGTFKLYGYTN